MFEAEAASALEVLERLNTERETTGEKDAEALIQAAIGVLGVFVRAVACIADAQAQIAANSRPADVEVKAPEEPTSRWLTPQEAVPLADKVSFVTALDGLLREHWDEAKRGKLRMDLLDASGKLQDGYDPSIGF